MHIIGFFTCFHGISRTQSFQENRPFIFQVRVLLKMLVSLMGLLVACSARIAAYRWTDRQTVCTVQYCNPCCTCTPRDNSCEGCISDMVDNYNECLFGKKT